MVSRAFLVRVMMLMLRVARFVKARITAAWHRWVMLEDGPRTCLVACRIVEVLVEVRVMKCTSCVAALAV